MRNIDSETEEYTLPQSANYSSRRQKSDNATQNASSRQQAATTNTSAKRRKTKKKKDSYTFVDFIQDYRTHLGVGVILCLIGIIMAVVCVSFLFNNDADQSIVHGHSISEIVASGHQVENAGGAAGAKLAELLMVRTFGIASFILAFYIFVVSMAVMHIRKISFFSFTFRCLFTTAAVSIIIGLITFNRANMFHLGGEHGYYMNLWLYDYTGALGAYCASVLLIGLLIAVYFYPLKKFAAMLGNVIHRKPAIDSYDVDDTVDNEKSALELQPALDKFESDVDDLVDKPTNDEVDKTENGNHSEEEYRLGQTVFEKTPGLDSFGENDDTESDSTEVDDAPVKKVDELDGPSFEIVNNPQPETDSNSLIRHGDHITLDHPYDVRASHSNFVFPPTSLLIDRSTVSEINEEEQLANKELIVNTLRSYKIEITSITATIGPTVTLYEIVPEGGTRIAKIKMLEDDIAMSLSALGIRIIAPMPGKGTVGIEVPNRKPRTVSMKDIVESKLFANTKMALPLALGATISNDYFMTDLAKLPHLLVAGATGQGKSVGLNCIITSLLYSKHPDELKFVLVDPKSVEFTLYESISKQYLAKLPDEEKAVITDPNKVVATLNSLCVEMENRYKLLSAARVRAINEYNDKFIERRLNPEDGHRFMPYIVVIVDEYADLVMVVGREVSVPIARITQKARAVGIHMILATQRPSTDVITGMIKNNFTARIAFKVTQGVDSKTIIDRPGAQNLIGKGDMLTLINGTLDRVQCSFVDTPEVEAICEHIGNQQGFVSCYELPEPQIEGAETSSEVDFGAITEEFKNCALFISTQTSASITSLQRKFEIGFNKAARYMDKMESMGIVGRANGSKPREVCMTPDEVKRLFE
ncbi:MAG: DNA translocase FtsK 4TM domain-containing protein [Muribaculaceae bacterium]|nr:DNA translocase FtsK 4TM domain-containing protein [Muribaculaceae bacterium]